MGGFRRARFCAAARDFAITLAAGLSVDCYITMKQEHQLSVFRDKVVRQTRMSIMPCFSRSRSIRSSSSKSRASSARSICSRCTRSSSDLTIAASRSSRCILSSVRAAFSSRNLVIRASVSSLLRSLMRLNAGECY